MKRWYLLLIGGICIALTAQVAAESSSMKIPKTIQAGSDFSIETTGSGAGTVYIVGLGQVLKKSVQLGEAISFPVGSLHDAGRYLVILVQESGVETDSLDVTPADPAQVSFLAKPSRLPVSLQHGITGAAYVFDAYGNLVVAPTPLSFELSSPSGTDHKNDVTTRDGAAWTEMDTSGKQGVAQFTAWAGGISTERVVRQVPGDPCGLKFGVSPAGQQLELKTEPVLDCSGNPVLDGTIVTFTETYNGGQSTVDVPLKHGIAQASLPAHSGAMLSAASGVVLGNQIRWGQ